MSRRVRKHSSPQVKALVNWYGSNRSLAANVGIALRGCSLCVLPFCGGMTELLEIPARTFLVNDKHLHVINLARVLQDQKHGPRLIRDLRRMAYHRAELESAQVICRQIESGGWSPKDTEGCYLWARAYFVASWMGRAGLSGTDKEFEASYSIRYHSIGGDSCTRFRSAVEGLRHWRKLFVNCTFESCDAIELIHRIHDIPENAIYCDPPFIEYGGDYRHKMTIKQHIKLAVSLSSFRHAKIVVRFGLHKFVDTLYPKHKFQHEILVDRNQANQPKQELLITRNIDLAIPEQEYEE
jgi:DNA adenine methylase